MLDDVMEEKKSVKESTGKAVSNSAGKRSRSGGKSKIKRIVDCEIVQNKSLLDFFGAGKTQTPKKDQDKVEVASAKTLIQRQGKKESTLKRKQPDGDLLLGKESIVENSAKDIYEQDEKVVAKSTRGRKTIKTNKQAEDDGNFPLTKKFRFG